jgi:hypothetical protein
MFGELNWIIEFLSIRLNKTVTFQGRLSYGILQSYSWISLTLFIVDNPSNKGKWDCFLGIIKQLVILLRCKYSILRFKNF